jgi:cytochrome c peroxidase
MSPSAISSLLGKYSTFVMLASLLTLSIPLKGIVEIKTNAAAPDVLRPSKSAQRLSPLKPLEYGGTKPSTIALGRALYFDKDLSADGATSCATWP